MDCSSAFLYLPGYPRLYHRNNLKILVACNKKCLSFWYMAIKGCWRLCAMTFTQKLRLTGLLSSWTLLVVLARGKRALESLTPSVQSYMCPEDETLKIIGKQQLWLSYLYSVLLICRFMWLKHKIFFFGMCLAVLSFSFVLLTRISFCNHPLLSRKSQILSVFFILSALNL